MTHPLGVAAFGREATPPRRPAGGGQPVRRAVPDLARHPDHPQRQGAGGEGKTKKFILVRTGEERQGVVGFFQPGLVGEQAPGLSVRFTGINRSAIASYLVTSTTRWSC